jgi:flavorubredoxin
MKEVYSPTEDTHVLPTYYPVPGFGILPVNAFVLKAKEPVLVDAGLLAEQEEFISTLSSVIDPKELKWLWLTHTDLDHIGSLQRLLQEVPQLHVITTYLGAGKMGMISPLPMDRVYFLNPGQSLDIGDRKLTAMKPPSFDAPETTGFFDSKTRALFSSDCFGAVMSSPAQDARDISRKELNEFQLMWATVDSPWLQSVDRQIFGKTLNTVRDMSPSMILSSHLPPAQGMTEDFLKTLASARDAKPFVGPDQEALQQMLAQLTQGTQESAA